MNLRPVASGGVRAPWRYEARGCQDSRTAEVSGLSPDIESRHSNSVAKVECRDLIDSLFFIVIQIMTFREGNGRPDIVHDRRTAGRFSCYVLV